VRILLWHVHGAWTTAFVHGSHQYLIPTLPDRGPDGRGRAQTYTWPRSAVEVTPERAARAEVRWLGGRRPGRDLPAVYLEHNAPQGTIDGMRHPAADRPDLHLVHVTHFNQLFWDAGTTPTRVIEHGVVDPGERWSGTVERAAVVINEPSRRGRVTGTDLLGRLAAAVPIDLFGIGSERVGDGDRVRAHGDLPHDRRLLDELARRRLYLHPVRWTSLGLSLLEAMHLGMPVVGLATTEVVEAVPPEAGLLSTRVDTLADAAAELLRDPERARVMGKAARTAALARYGLRRFLGEWDQFLEEVVT
jgi:hypothetical protein